MARGNVIPSWVRNAADEALAVHGLGQTTAARFLVEVPPGFLISDGQGGEREALPGEKRPLGEFVSQRRIGQWIASDRMKELRARLANQHTVRLEVKARELMHVAADNLMMLLQGKQPRLDEYGEHEIAPDGRPLYNPIKASEWVQAGQLALKIAEHAAGPPTQRVEMEHSGKIAGGPSELSDDELQRKIAENLKAMGAASGLG